MQQKVFSQDEINESIEDYSVNSDILTSNVAQQYETPIQYSNQSVQPAQPVQPTQPQNVGQSVQTNSNKEPNDSYNEWYEEDE